MMHRLPFAAVLAAFVSTACEHSYTKPGTADAAPGAAAARAPTPEELARVRAEALALIDDPFWPFGRREYVVTEPSFVDPCILEIIGKSYGYDGSVPTDDELRLRAIGR